MGSVYKRLALFKVGVVLESLEDRGEPVWRDHHNPGSGFDVGRASMGQIGDEVKLCQLGSVLREQSVLDVLSTMDVVFIYVFENYLVFNRKCLDRMPEYSAFQSVPNPIVRSISELVARLPNPVLLMSQHGNYEESFFPYIPSQLSEFLQILSQSNVIGWVEWVPYQYHLMKKLLRKVVFCPMVYWPEGNTDLRKKDEISYDGPLRIVVGRSPAGVDWHDNGVQCHLVAQEISKIVGDVEVTYAERDSHIQKDYIKRTLGIDTHVSTGWFDSRSQRIDDLRKSHLFIQLGWRMSRSGFSTDAAVVGVPSVVSNRLFHQVLYPKTSVDPFQVSRAVSLGVRLLQDSSFRERVITTARFRAERFCSAIGVRRIVQDILRRHAA